jgi:hypothetical protein
VGSRSARGWARSALAAANLALALCAVPARGSQDGETLPALPPVDATWIDGVRLRFAAEGASGVDHGDASVSWLRGAGQLALESRLSERWAGGLAVSFQYVAPDVDGDASFLAIGTGSRPTFDDLLETTFGLGIRRTLGEDWAVGGQGYLSARFERGADVGDALQGGALFALEYEPSKRFRTLLGVRVGTRLDRNGVTAWPYVRLRWRIAERVRFRLDNTDAQLELRVRDGLHGFVYAVARFDRYRLAERAALPARENAGTLSLAEASSGVGLRWRASERVRLVARIGALFWQRLTVHDEHAERVDRSTTHDAAFFARIELQTRF